MSALALTLCACGGGSSSGVSGPPGTTSTTPGAAGTTTSSNAAASSVQGTVAYGRPVSGGLVVAVDVNGNKCGSATTASDGTYSMNTMCAPGPVEFAVLSGAPNNLPLMTVAVPANANAVVSGVVNITPLTTMIVYDFLGTQTVLSGVNSPNSFSQAVGFVPTLETTAYQLYGSSAAFAAISQAYQNSASRVLGALSLTLSNYGVSVASGFDPVTAPFTPNGQGIDKFFDDYPESVTGSNNLQLGSANPILSVIFSGSSSAPSTLGGTAAGSAGAPGTAGSAGSASATGIASCAPGTYCQAYLGKSVTISQTVLGTGSVTSAPQYQETCTGTVASTPTTVANGSLTGTIQVAMISGSCTVNGQTTALYGYVFPFAPGSNNEDPITTADGLGYSAASDWMPNAAAANGAFPQTFSLDTATSLGAVSGTLTIH
ncbi:MAG: hypothetical protein RBR52_14615 [Thiomonas sp.]|nr:hypothetical protein [Thiomonas sp.]